VVKVKFLFLFLLFAITAVAYTPQPGEIVAVWKVGDQPGEDGFRHGDLIEVLDPTEWSSELVIPDKARVIYLYTVHNASEKLTLRDKAKPQSSHGSPDYKKRKGTADFVKVAKKLGVPAGKVLQTLRDKTPNPVLSFKGVATPVKERPEQAKTSVNVLDRNALTSGTATLGTGGTYLTLTLLAADMGTQTGDVLINAVGEVVETSGATFTNDLNGNDFTIDFKGFNCYNQADSWFIRCEQTNSAGRVGDIIFKNGIITQSSALTSTYTLFDVAAPTANHIYYKDLIALGNTYGERAFRMSSSNVNLVSAVGCIANDFDDYAIIELNSSDILVENCLISNSSTGILVLGSGQGGHILRNTVFFNNGNHVNLDPGSIQILYCGVGGTGSGFDGEPTTGAVTGIVAGDFAKTTLPVDQNYFLPVEGGKLEAATTPDVFVSDFYGRAYSGYIGAMQVGEIPTGDAVEERARRLFKNSVFKNGIFKSEAYRF